jgi:hypothetical protein
MDDSMSAGDSTSQLRFGPYVTPVCVVGAILECEVRGLVTIVGLSGGTIRWPLGERDGLEEPVVFKGLARALRQESPAAVAAAWGVSVETAARWQAACRRPRHRRKQTVSSPPIAWKKADDELLARVSLAEAACLTGRTITAVRKRRRILGLPDRRVAAQRAVKTQTVEQQVVAAQLRLRDSMDRIIKSHAAITETCRTAKARLAYWHSKTA